MDEAPAPRPAGFWIRAVALALDLVVFALVQSSFGWLATRLLGPTSDADGSPHGSAIVFTLLFTAVYSTVLHTVAGQTIGKSLVGVRVVGLDGARLTAGPAFLSWPVNVLEQGHRAWTVRGYFRIDSHTSPSPSACIAMYPFTLGPMPKLRPVTMMSPGFARS